MAHVRIPEELQALTERPWVVVLLIAAAFMFPLVVADALRGDGSPRQLAEVTTVATDAPAGPRIPDLRPAVALPRMQPDGPATAPDTSP